MEKIKIGAVTYNVATFFPSEGTDASNLLGLGRAGWIHSLPDIFVIGCQEVKSQPQNVVYDAIFDDPWSSLFKEALSARGYVRVRSCRLQGIVLQLLVKRHLLLRIRDLEDKYVRLGLGGVWGNKGAVCLRFSLDGVNVCLVNSHLAAHDHNLEDRIQNYADILEQARFQDSQTTRILYHDYVLWVGDLNFRIGGRDELDDEEVREMIEDHELTPLLARDQLRQAMADGSAFSELHEPTLTFRPTYKFIPGQRGEYTTSRRPAWTDRILYRVNADVYEGHELSMKPHNYQSHPYYTISDHIPVSAEFVIKVFRDHPVGRVEFLPISVWLIGSDCVAKYRREETLVVSNWDWIGLFKADFAALDEYVTYVWAPRDTSSPNSDHYVAVFPEDSVSVPGSYVLVYFGRNERGVYGVSEPFDIEWPHRHSRRDQGASTDTNSVDSAEEPLLSGNEDSSDSSSSGSSHRNAFHMPFISRRRRSEAGGTRRRRGSRRRSFSPWGRSNSTDRNSSEERSDSSRGSWWGNGNLGARLRSGAAFNFGRRQRDQESSSDGSSGECCCC